jgi:diguanylate cyclase (GGDEF)-like protein
MPEWVLAGAWLITAVGIAAGVALSGGAHSPAKSWLLAPAISLPARFNRRGVYAGTAICLALLAVVTIGIDPHEVIASPQLFIFPAALIAAAMALSMTLHDAELHHRNEAVLDQLTGMLNRKALEQRSLELELQSRITGQPVGLVVCDIDHFKRVNDERGHDGGDTVLVEIAATLRGRLRAEDELGRLGGEEFLALLPDTDARAAHKAAEHMRENVGETGVTISIGWAAWCGEEADELLRRADDALYAAKAQGRNCVKGAPATLPRRR